MKQLSPDEAQSVGHCTNMGAKQLARDVEEDVEKLEPTSASILNECEEDLPGLLIKCPQISFPLFGLSYPYILRNGKILYFIFSTTPPPNFRRVCTFSNRS